MRQPEQFPSNLVVELAQMRKRLLDLERRVVPKPPRTLDDLDDVEVLYDSTTDAPNDTDALVWDATRSLWVPGGAGGNWATIKVVGSWDTAAGGTFGATAAEWADQSGVGALSVVTGGAAEGFEVTDAGIYLVTLEMSSAGAAITTVGFSSEGWQLDGESGECRPSSAAYVGSAVERVTVSDHMALPAGAVVEVFFDGSSGSCDWRLSAHHVASVAVIAGDCGG